VDGLAELESVLLRNLDRARVMAAATELTESAITA
jgi:hypothetical protein